ncbi:phosphate/phosphite/phosphonate ABC transporter substrate-binding protein [Marinobacter salinisoli]|uniref:Phosphate/phosphite/phosphonate ABC transporter substrate-binding protein n=1 Tax=Marinobacter salinisoli TaxID=2769486 RepID=A0ABX7MNW9_9GAMM|nr:phosphate/phosphite/phosphonate ABC transporter substrate-binding protein [Marinobacter salinisoli]QSP93970.1 phosphate/phosphite/phosphonate ABC transporter substrate-binding protein [Marinobacter salinisoli]
MTCSLRVIFLLSAILVSVPGVASAQQSAPKVYTFGVVPQQASEKLARQWLPLMAYLTEKTGSTVRFATAPNIPEFERRLADGVYDFAYMNPYHFTVFSEDPGYSAVARQSNHVIRGIIVVSSDLKIGAVEELAGQSVAFPAPNAFAATLITRAHLDEAAPGYQAEFVKSHDSVYRSVAKGLFAAGGGIVRTLNEVEPEIREQLEVLWLSPGYTGHAIAAHPRVTPQTKALVEQALSQMHESERGRSILEELDMKGFQAAANTDWDDVRDLGINAQ